jgi:heme oxygenase
MIEINGKIYERKPMVQNNTPKMTSKMAAFLMMGMVLSGVNIGGNNISKELENIDIIKEFGLIQLKKSNLSRSKRDWVVYQFNKHFYEVLSSNNL